MKRVCSLLLTILLIFTFCVFAIASGEDTSSDQGSNTADKGTVDSDTVIGNYSLVIDSCRLAKDYSGDKIAIVKYIFTNNADDDGASFSLSFTDEAYQDGIGLNKSYLVDDSANYNADNQSKKIKKGSSIEVEVAYELNDDTTDIVIEVSEFISFNDTKITKTFTIK